MVRLRIIAPMLHASWFRWACLMGTVFISLFSIIAFTAQKIGVAVTSVANKLSLVIPFIFSIYLYNEKASWLKIAGVIIALVAVVLTCLPAKEEKTKSDHTLLYILPIALFLGSGLLDTMIKYVEHQFLVPENVNDYLITAFSTAAVLGLIVLTILLIAGKQQIQLEVCGRWCCNWHPQLFFYLVPDARVKKIFQ